MKTPEQLKGTIRSMAEKQNLRAQEVLQMYLFERFLERLAASRFKENFILKGGLLISSIENNIAFLKKNGYVERRGANKGGYRKILG